MARVCPDCETTMIDEFVDGVTLNACPNCAGVWIHPEGLTQILDADPAGLLEIEDKNQPKVEQKYVGKTLRNCPDDNMTLQEYHYAYDSPVIIQVCSDCGGFWIQDGQLRKMQAWINEAEGPITQKEKDALAVAQFTLDHENFMIRQENIREVCKRMSRWRTGWFV